MILFKIIFIVKIYTKPIIQLYFFGKFFVVDKNITFCPDCGFVHT